MLAEISFVLSQFTRLTDGQTDRQTDILLQWRHQAYRQGRALALPILAGPCLGRALPC